MGEGKHLGERRRSDAGEGSYWVCAPNVTARLQWRGHSPA